MLEKQQPIVALDHPQKPKKTRPPRNNLMLSLKKNNLELDLYSSLDPEQDFESGFIMINLYGLGQVYIVCGRTDMRRGIDGLAAIVKDKFDLDPEKYLKYLLYKLPNESTLTDKEALSAYLPWTKQVQASCR